MLYFLKKNNIEKQLQKETERDRVKDKAHLSKNTFLTAILNILKPNDFKSEEMLLYNRNKLYVNERANRAVLWRGAEIRLLNRTLI